MYSFCLLKNDHILQTSFTFLITIFLFSTVKAQTTDPSPGNSQRKSGAIIVRAYITLSAKQWKDHVMDSLKWHVLKPLKKYYEGKKVKRILYQKSTDRLLVFARRDSLIQMNKITAIHEGLIQADPTITWAGEKASFLPDRPIDIYLDSPLYVGKPNIISTSNARSNDVIVGSKDTYILKTANPDEYAVNTSLPGYGDISFKDSTTNRTKYIYHFVAKRLPGDGAEIEPEVSLGNIKTMNATVEELKAQYEMKVNNGLYFESATVYFSGNGYKDIIIADIQKQLGYVKCYLDMSLPGSMIIFDNIRVRDKNNKIYAANNIVIHVIDSSYLDDPSTDYPAMNNYPGFYGDNSNVEFYIKKELKIDADDNITPATQNVFLLLHIGTDGRIQAPCEDERTMTKLEKICFDIIKNGPEWTAGRFKEQPVPMIVPISFEVNVDEFMNK